MAIGDWERCTMRLRTYLELEWKLMETSREDVYRESCGNFGVFGREDCCSFVENLFHGRAMF